MTILALVAFVFSLFPALLFWRNWWLYRRPTFLSASTASVSILIPARNEERSIADAVRTALASRGVDLEVIVLDDHSTDATASIVQSIAQQDGRVTLATAPPLPIGWCGKQHACYALSQRAKHDLLLFVDADVRVSAEGIGQAVAFLEQSGADLVSGVPQQQTETLLERLLIPLIHFILLGFLPLGRMRTDSSPSLGAGCGQFFLARRHAYDAIGGHAAVKSSLHDGVTLPRAFRRGGFKTDLFDATDVATCRMYRNYREVWHGLAKNATEGLAAPAMIVPATLLLFAGQVLPVILMVIASLYGATLVTWFALICAIAAIYSIRVAAAIRFRQSWLGALLHPLGISLFLLIQWYAFARLVAGKPATWKDRSYQSASDQSADANQAVRLTCSNAKNVS